MKLTKTQKRSMAEAFRKAAEVLVLEKTPGYNVRRVYICLAIEDVESDHHTVELCWKVIERRLNCATLASWLQHEAKIDPSELTFEAVQQHRFNWLQQLIAEFSH